MEPNNQAPFIKSVLIAALAFSLFNSILTIYFGYQAFQAEPSGGLLPPGTVSGLFICFIALFVGLVATKLEAMQNPVMTLGRGALMGLVAGLLYGFFTFFFSETWNLIDPDYAFKLAEVQVAHLERMPGVSEEQLQSMSDEVFKTLQSFSARLLGLAINSVIMGIGNAISGLLGAHIFGTPPIVEDF